MRGRDITEVRLDTLWIKIDGRLRALEMKIDYLDRILQRIEKQSQAK